MKRTATTKSLFSHPVIPVSAKEETGIGELEEQIRKLFFQEKTYLCVVNNLI